MGKKLTALFIAFTLCVNLVTISVASTSDDLKKKQQELYYIQQQLDKINREKREKKKIVNQTNQKINGIESSIETIESDLDQINSNMISLTQSIKKASQDLNKANLGIVEKKQYMNNRLRTMYKAGSIGYVQILLGSKNIVDLMTRVDIIQKIYGHDKRLVEYMTAQVKTIEVKKQSLINYQKKLNNLSNEKASKQVALNSNLMELTVAKEKVSKDLKALEAQEDEFVQDANKVTSIIKKLKLSVTYVGGKMGWPAPGASFKPSSTNQFGWRIHPIFKVRKLHTGIDIGMKYGSPIVAAQDGKVIYSDWFGGYGKAVMIDHGGGIVTLYGHNSSLVVKVGQKVTRGQTISKCGSTGNSTGPHLHFEVRVKGEYVDPMKWLK